MYENNQSEMLMAAVTYVCIRVYNFFCTMLCVMIGVIVTTVIVKFRLTHALFLIYMIPTMLALLIGLFLK